ALESKVDIQPSPVQKQEVVELTQAPQTPEEFESWFELMDSTSPIDMLASWSKSEPTLKQKYMIEDLMVREQLPFGVINI
ncbi:MAG: replication initiation and membrane attachment family protein, partial [Staphylococcus carnosus]